MVLRSREKNERRCTMVDLNVTFTLTVLSPKQIRGANLNETAYPKGALIRTRTLIKKKQIRGGRLLSTVLRILLFKRVSSRFFRTVISYRAVSYPNLVHSYPV